MFSSIDLFAGIGGIRLGFDNAFKGTIKNIFTCEWDKPAQKTYRANFAGEYDIVGDIRDLDEKTVPSFDICLAGFPCQAFSFAGTGGGLDDNFKGYNRGVLFLDVIRICHYHKPKVIFCENVKGLVSHDRGKTFRIILNSFAEIGYRVFWKVLNSKDFGVPQNRERVYLVAFRQDLGIDEFKFPIGDDKVSCIQDIMENAPIPAKYYLSENYLESLRKYKAKQMLEGNGYGYVLRDINGIAGTIVCGGMGHERNLIVDDRPHIMIFRNLQRGGKQREYPQDDS